MKISKTTFSVKTNALLMQNRNNWENFSEIKSQQSEFKLFSDIQSLSDLVKELGWHVSMKISKTLFDKVNVSLNAK
jgi:hypothetical protein